MDDKDLNRIFSSEEYMKNMADSDHKTFMRLEAAYIARDILVAEIENNEAVGSFTELATFIYNFLSKDMDGNNK